MKKIILACLATFALSSVAQVTPNLWKEYKENPNSHPNIPNCSYAGYRYGDVALPSGIGQTYNVKTQYGAKGDGSTDDTEAIRNAIKAAETAGGGVVYIPNGDYICSGVLFVNGDNVIIRGESKDNTKLRFTKSLTDGYSPNYTEVNGSLDQIIWSWAGGMVWFTPKSKNTYLTSKPNNLINTWLNGYDTYMADKEAWNIASQLASITSNEDRGQFTFSVNDASKIKEGDYISIRYSNTSDWSLMKYFTGEGTFANNYTWGSGTGWINSTNRPFVDWVVQVDKVIGNRITLKQPLRVPLRSQWQPTVMGMGDLIKESGIENLTIELEKDYESNYQSSSWRNANHNREKGWNGIYMNNAINCFARNIVIYDSEMGAGTAASKNVTFTDIKIHGKDQKKSTHHGFTCRRQSQDILFENFELMNYDQFDHGINVEDFSMGNVWHSGIVMYGCFDTHKLIPAECLRTNIKVAVGGGYGGAGEAGPQIGTRFVHWNVELKSNVNNTITPSTTMPMGAIVGVTGDKPSSSEASGCIVEASNLLVNPSDLYVDQKKLRNGIIQSESLLSPWPVWNAPNVGEKTLRIEGEDAKVSFIGLDDDSLDDGSNVYLKSFNSPDRFAEYDINVPVSGKYKFEFRVCSEDKGENILSIQEKGVELGRITFIGTGRGGNNWRTIEAEILLNPGMHTLQLFGLKGLTCLNYFKINAPHEYSQTPFPTFETQPGVYNGMVKVALIKPENTDVFYRIEGQGTSFSTYTEPLELSKTTTITAAAKSNNVWSLYNTGTFEVIEPVEIPCRILAIDYTDQKGMSIQNIEGSNNQLSVGQAGDWATWFVSATEEGEYQINTRISIKLRDGVTSTGFELYINGEPMAKFANLPDMGGNWDRFKVYPAIVKLNKGVNEIKVVALDRRFTFDWIEIFKAPPFEVPVVIEAENYHPDSQNFGLHRSIDTSDGRNPGYEVSVSNGTKLYYPIYVEKGGTYPVKFLFSSKSDNITARLLIKETGEILAQYNAKNMGGAKEQSHDAEIKLHSGNYTLCLEQIAGGEHYVDQIIINDATSYDPDDGEPTNVCEGIISNDYTPYLYDNQIKVNFESPQHYIISNLLGTQIKTGLCDQYNPVDISKLANGVYLFAVNNKSVLKFSKTKF